MPIRLPNIVPGAVIALDTETTGLHWWSDEMFSFSFAIQGGPVGYVDIRQHPGAVRWVRDQIAAARVCVAHNAKFDHHFLRQAGAMPDPRKWECTVTRAALIDEHLLTYDLDSLGKKYIGIGKDGDIWTALAAMFGGRPTRHAQAENLMRAPLDMASKYATQDATTCLRLWEWQEQELAQQDLTKVWALEKRLLPVLIDLEHRGVRVDVGRAQEAVEKIDAIIRTNQTLLNDMVGFDINVNSSPQLARVFKPEKVGGAWRLIDGTVADETEGGAASLNAATMRAAKHPAAALVLRIRKDVKTRDTFLRGHILGHHHDGVIHANFNQTKSDNDLGTGTGRLSVNDPALQQIHKRDKETAAIVRALFLPDEGQEWVCADWAQMDFRVFAHYTGDPAILSIYADDPDADFHALVAGLTGLPRSPRFAGDPNAKQINLGLVFGMGPGKLAAEMGLPYDTVIDDKSKKARFLPGDQAKQVFALYHTSVPSVKRLLDDASAAAKRRGFVRTVMGRKIRFPRGQFTHKAGGLIFQGTAADALKVKLCEVHEELSGTSSRLLLNVHDEFDASMPMGDTAAHERLRERITQFDGQGTPIRFRVPIRSELGTGANWWEASK